MALYNILVDFTTLSILLRIAFILDYPFRQEAEKRAHHNALERKRRDHIKDSFSSLRDSVPALQNEKVVSILLIDLVFL